MNKPWADTIRRETGLVEHVCEHNVGHPARGSVQWMGLAGPEGAKGSWGVHGCCGCCSTPEWKLADALEGLEIANALLFAAKERIAELVQECNTGAHNNADLRGK